MKLKEIMSTNPVKIHPQESAAVAARALTHYNIGALPVCGSDGKLCGILTDRDLVTRCLATGKSPDAVKVSDVMTGRVVSADADMDTGAAAHLMGREQIRRLPVVENGKLCGIVSLGDLAVNCDCNPDAADALGDICSGISDR